MTLHLLSYIRESEKLMQASISASLLHMKLFGTFTNKLLQALMGSIFCQKAGDDKHTDKLVF